jgi:predicted RNase H-like HicB family nuclease
MSEDVDPASERRRIHGMKFVVTVDRDEDRVFVAECPAIPGCVSQGTTESEALKNIEDAIRKCLEVRAEKGMPLTVAVHQVDISV